MRKRIRYRTKMILAYATLSLLASLALGYYAYHKSAAYERERQLQGMEVAAKTCLYQVEDLLNRLDAILYYVISDPEALDGITLLSRGEEGAPPSYQRKARETISSRISSEYIRDNSYRTVFFNQHGFFTSSSINVKNNTQLTLWRLRDSFSLEELSYLPLAIEGRGKTVVIPPHLDYWGATGEVMVFSLMKALQGEGMGFLEAEYRLSDLSFLRVADPEIELQVVLKEGEVLYSSGELSGENPWVFPREGNVEKMEEIALGQASLAQESGANGNGLEEAEGQEKEFWRGDGYVYSRVSSQEIPLFAVSRKSLKILDRYQSELFFNSFLAAFLAFSFSLLVIVLWSKLFTAPIQRLRKVVDQTNMENLEEAGLMEGARGGIDEFAELTHAFQSMTRRVNLAIQKERRAEMLQLHAQYDLLQTQVNPHFIYNVLNIISARAVMADDEVICEMCGCLGKMLRYSTNTKVRQGSVGEELEYLDSYFFLLKCRYEDKLTVKVEIPESLKKKPLPKMTLQQVVENSIKHGFHNTSLDMELQILGEEKEEEKSWQISILDNGPGAREEALSSLRERLEDIRMDFESGRVKTEAQLGGMGLTNLYSRCLLAYGLGFAITLQNRKEPKGFEVRLSYREPS